jgi:hypothetical protein
VVPNVRTTLLGLPPAAPMLRQADRRLVHIQANTAFHDGVHRFLGYKAGEPFLVLRRGPGAREKPALPGVNDTTAKSE